MRNQNRIVLSTIVGLALAVGACKKKDEAKDTKKPEVGEPKPADPGAGAAPASGACAAGLAGGGDVPFCITLPAGFAAKGKPEKPDREFKLDFTKDGSMVEIYTKWSDDAKAYDSMVDMMAQEVAEKKYTVIEKGDLAGGNGKFILYVSSVAGSESQRKQMSIESYFKSSKWLLRCSTSWWTDPEGDAKSAALEADGKAGAEACKSLTPQ